MSAPVPTPEPAGFPIDLDRCIASGICAATAPTHFTKAPDGRARLRPDAPPPTPEAEDAAFLCPMEAITRHPPIQPT
ncbi:ferredoxin [Embleya sp. NPDC020630]|uniref:ferredoxin n=1 Tax=Embleya sp. NPDC020630 TaxID=3363979 RepID=UPI0037A89209